MNIKPISKLKLLSALQRACLVLVAVLPGTSAALAEINVASVQATPVVAFSGESVLDVVVSNSASKSFAGNIQVRLYECSSATIMPVGPAKAWKKIEAPSGKRTIETVAVDYPSVSSETIFQLRFFDETRNVVGKMTVRILPTDLLKQLSTLSGTNQLGIYDPENQLKPVLSRLQVAFEDLEDDGRFDGFHGNVLLAGPFSASAKITESLQRRISAKAKASCSVIWMLPPHVQGPFASVFMRKKSGSEAILRDAAFKDLAHSASAQFDLLRSVQFSLYPDKSPLSHNQPTPK
jgi:hypothetical protein